MAFHVRIAAISGNHIYPAVSEEMLGWLQEYHSHILIWEGRGAQTLAEHAEIIARIEAGDPDGAERALSGHLERSNHLYVHGEAAAD
jgi:DNA-binding FadR family transcriptional regulator